jgi:hypothetical protein
LIRFAFAIAFVATCALAAVTASHATGMGCCKNEGFFQGYTAPGQGGDSLYDDLCNSAIRAVIDQTPGAYYSTVALIDRNGGWRRSARSTNANVYVAVSPDTEAGANAYSKKAHCNNSSNATVYSMTCALSKWYIVSGICV